MLSFGALFLATNHIIGRGVHELLPPVGLSFWRWLAALLFIWPLVAGNLRQSAPKIRAHSCLFFVLGGLIMGSTTAILVALNHTTAINTSLINALQPIFTASISWAFFARRLNTRQWLGVLVAFLGITTMICRGRAEVLLTLNFAPGDVLAIAAILGFSIYSVNVFRLPPELNPAEHLFGIIAYGCVLLLPAYLYESFTYRAMPMTFVAISTVLSLAFFVSFLAMLIWNLAIRAIGPDRASIFINLIPIFGALLAVVFLHESFHWFHFLGIILVGCGIFAVVQPRAATAQRASAEPRD